MTKSKSKSPRAKAKRAAPAKAPRQVKFAALPADPELRRIEIWENAGRVLQAMPDHEREKHWDMSTWGTKTSCGTVACAAGHCGLDPWFRDHGFKLDFINGDSRISDVKDFFGLEGSARVFFNPKKRSVDTVLEEVREFAADLKASAEIATRLGLPAIGDEWPEQGGIFAGIRICKNGAPNYALILGPEHEGFVNWDAANSWAAALSVASHRDFTLPDRGESAALFDRLRSAFKPSGYWTSEQHADYSGHAWYQNFSNGYQNYWFKDSYFRARAVRRFRL